MDSLSRIDCFPYHLQGIELITPSFGNSTGTNIWFVKQLSDGTLVIQARGYTRYLSSTRPVSSKSATDNLVYMLALTGAINGRYSSWLPHSVTDSAGLGYVLQNVGSGYMMAAENTLQMSRTTGGTMQIMRVNFEKGRWFDDVPGVHRLGLPNIVCTQSSRRLNNSSLSHLLIPNHAKLSSSSATYLLPRLL
jgi:hypothetical protein